MKEKSKFLTFLLSFVPGLAHFYNGYVDRGLIYLLVIGLGGLVSLALGFIFVGGAAIVLFIAGYGVVWLIALIDVFSVMNNRRFNPVESENTNEGEIVIEERTLLNKKMITLALSIIPGAGHMYLGQQKKGLTYMSMFFFSIFFMGWLRLSFLIFILPVIWFYVFFDAFHLVNENGVEEDFDLISFLPKVSNSFIGKALICIGIVVIFNNIFYPLLMQYLDFGYMFVNYAQTLIVALILIVIGVRMLRVKNEILRGEEDEN